MVTGLGGLGKLVGFGLVVVGALMAFMQPTPPPNWWTLASRIGTVLGIAVYVAVRIAERRQSTQTIREKK